MRIFVTGKNGKVGNAFFEYMCRRHPDVMVDRVSVKPDVLCQLDFSGYDAVYCCIGITDENSSELFSVNRDLCFEIAKKSRDEGVKDFIYLSSMAVYDFSESSNMSPVCADTPANPVRNYGRSKIEGEKLIKQLSDDSFRVHIVRAPSIYGYGLDAYLQYYKRQADRRVFLDAFHDMKRSAIYADNLSELVYLICTGNNAESLSYYFPQNRDAMSYIEF
ncbi:MAG: sugar nucleotide-binding protein, partial [Clostridia bacterium]|nr:sugar nucleotide-binding protein [Clostridia bacterium]